MWEIVATRNGVHQCLGIEIMAVADTVANGKVRVKLTADSLQAEAVAITDDPSHYFELIARAP